MRIFGYIFSSLFVFVIGVVSLVPIPASHLARMEEVDKAASLARIGEVDKTATLAVTTDEVDNAASANRAASLAHIEVKTLVVEPAVLKVGDAVPVSDAAPVVEGALFLLGWQDEADIVVGERRVLVNVAVVNFREVPMPVYSIAQMALEDEGGQKYYADFLATASAVNGWVDGEIYPGESARGQVVFKLPECAHDLKFVFTYTVDDSLREVAIDLAGTSCD